MGIVHRDLTPRNILLSTKEGKLTAKVIDFGLSVDVSRLRLRPLKAAGTTPYMAPEQAGRSTTGISSRTDIYALGLCIFELLTGERAIPMLKGETTEVYLDRKCGSTFRLPSLGEYPKLKKSLGAAELRELDSVLLKATSAEPMDRYSTADELRLDLLAIQSHRPTSLRAGDKVHRTRLSLRRNRTPLLTVATFIGLAFIARSLITSQRSRADRAVTESGDFAKNLMDRVNPIITRKQPTTTDEEAIALATAVGEESETLEVRDTDPFLTARMTAANTLQALDASDLSITELEAIVADCAKRFGEDDDDTLAAQMHLAGAYIKVRRMSDAEPIYRKANEVWKNRYGINDERTLSTVHYISQIKQFAGHYESAIALSDKIVEHYRPGSTQDDMLLIGVRFTRGQCLSSMRRYREAIEDYEFVKRGFLEAGLWQSHPTLLMIGNDIALAESRSGDCESAVKRMTEVAASTEQVYPNGAFAIDKANINLAVILMQCGQREEGEQQLLDVELQRAPRGDEEVGRSRAGAHQTETNEACATESLIRD